MQHKNNSERFEALDALRGVSILLMVLSSSIAFGGILPAWMYHAQEPPPTHIFNPDLPGISWVDLVFPFFLFSMGMAIPLSLHKRIEQKGNFQTVISILQRFIFLAFFAIFTNYARAWVMQKEPQKIEHFISIGCFVILFLIYNNWEKFFSKTIARILKYSGIFLGIAFLMFYPFYNGFHPDNSDIIILLLANMALFGGLIWMFTRKNFLLRIGVLPFIVAVFFAADVNGSWNHILYYATPAEWLYKFYFLKYLFIIIPGTLAGDWLLNKEQINLSHTRKSNGIALISFITIVLNVWMLFSRHLVINLFLTILLSVLLLYLIQKNSINIFLKKIIQSGIYLLLLGLFFEAWQGGIKKDFSTYSYYFVTTGLAFLFLSCLLIIEKNKIFKSSVRYFSAIGKNPMIAYTAGNLFLIPFLKLTGLYTLLDGLHHNAFQGFLRGVIFTGIVSLITIFFTNKKVFWKT
jgi:predicted acyltransferase